MNAVLDVFFIFSLIFVIYMIYLKYIKKSSSSNNSNSIFTPKNIFNYSPGLLNVYLNVKSDLNSFKGDENGFKATLLDLINKNYIIFLNQDISNSIKKNNHYRALFVKINKKKSLNKLKPYEIDLINFLKRYNKKGVISLDFIKEDLKNLKSSKKFESRHNSWENHLKNEYLNNKFFLEDSTEFMNELDDFKSYISGPHITNVDISNYDVNKFLVYGTALCIEKKTMKNFEKYFDENSLRNSQIYRIIKSGGLNFVDQGFKGLYLVKSGQHDPYTDVYGYGP